MWACSGPNVFWGDLGRQVGFGLVILRSSFWGNLRPSFISWARLLGLKMAQAEGNRDHGDAGAAGAEGVEERVGFQCKCDSAKPVVTLLSALSNGKRDQFAFVSANETGTVFVVFLSFVCCAVGA